MKAVVRLSPMLALMVLSGGALADSPKLKGAYAFTGFHACLFAPGTSTSPTNPTPGTALPNSGFNASLQPNAAKSFSASAAVEGIRTFNGNGTGTVKGRSVGLAVPPTPGPTGSGYPTFPPSASSDDFSFSFTYTVNGDGSFTTQMTPGSYVGSVVAGPRAGQTYTIDMLPPQTGMIGVDGRDLVVANVDAAVETVSYSNGDVWPRICNRSRVLVRVQNDRDRD